MPEQVQSYKKAGLTDHVGKPIEFEHLLGVVERFAKRIGSEDRERAGDREPERMAG
jgi:FixJ family two-component response regulator